MICHPDFELAWSILLLVLCCVMAGYEAGRRNRRTEPR